MDHATTRYSGKINWVQIDIGAAAKDLDAEDRHGTALHGRMARQRCAELET